MTRDEIHSMTAGRKIDTLISKHIFGLEISEEDGMVWIDGFLEEIPDYSSDINLAWEVVEKFPEVHIEHAETNNFVMIGDDFDTAVSTPRLPLSICRAALLAKVDL